MGLEPTTPGTTNQCSNQLSYNLRIELECKIRQKNDSVKFCDRFFIYFFLRKNYLIFD